MKKDNIIIRNMRPDEFEKVCKFTRKRKETKDFGYLYKSWKLDKDTYVMTVDGIIVGMICYHVLKTKDMVNLYYLIIRKKYRRRGYALKMMKHLFGFSKRWRKSKLKFKCKIESTANKFYKKNYGFKPIGKTKDEKEYIYEDLLIP